MCEAKMDIQFRDGNLANVNVLGFQNTFYILQVECTLHCIIIPTMMN